MARKGVTRGTLCPCSKHILPAQLKIGLARHAPTCIEHQFIMTLNGNFVNYVLNGSSSIVQLQFSLEIHQTYGIMQGGFA